MGRIYLDNCCFNRPFDDTKWRVKNLDNALTVRELSKQAMELIREVR